jgi:hypothetical protein
VSGTTVPMVAGSFSSPALIHSSTLRLTVALSADDRARAAAFRREVFFDRRGVLLDEALEAQRDREGHVFLLLDGSTPVATARVLPYPSTVSPMLELGQASGCLGAEAEVGRIAAVRSPGAARASLALLTLGSRWLLGNTHRQRYIAYCHPKLVEIYRLVGAEDLGVSCIVPGRSDAHRIVTGTFADAARLGARLLGIPESEVRQ